MWLDNLALIIRDARRKKVKVLKITRFGYNDILIIIRLSKRSAEDLEFMSCRLYHCKLLDRYYPRCKLCSGTDVRLLRYDADADNVEFSLFIVSTLKKYI